MTAGTNGRPLRFLLVLLLIWSSGRVAMHVAAEPDPPAHVEVAARRAGDPVARKIAALAKPAADLRRLGKPARLASTFTPRKQPTRQHSRASSPSSPILTPIGTALIQPPPVQPQPPTATPPPRTTKLDGGRWSLSTWLFWRDGRSPSALAGAGQLGGSQAGARIDFDLAPDASGRLTAYARVTGALAAPHAPEAAAGLSLQPSRDVPVSLAVERRQALGPGGRNAFAFLAVAGVGPRNVAPGISIEGYGQAGMVGLRQTDVFADGRFSVVQALAPLPLSAGVALSGGAQPGVHRLDIGPQLQARLSSGTQSLRMTVEWRERIAGNAAPGSGPALTLAADF